MLMAEPPWALPNSHSLLKENKTDHVESIYTMEIDNLNCQKSDLSPRRTSCLTFTSTPLETLSLGFLAFKKIQEMILLGFFFFF